MTEPLSAPITSEPEAEKLEQLAEEIIEEIERPERGEKDNLAPDSAGGWLPELDLPSFEEKDETCGDPRVHFCSECGDEMEIGRTCARSMCSRCWSAWVLKRAGTSREAGRDVPGLVAQLHKTAKMMSSRLDTPVYKHHLIISPLMDDWFLKAEDPLNRTFEVIHEIMKILGIEGVVFFHPYRGRHEDHDGGDKGEWKRRIGAGREWRDVRADLIPWGHFHIVGCAPFVPGGDMVRRIEQETGWVIKRSTKYNSNRSLSDLEDVAAAVTYCLSHTGIDTSADQNKAAYRKFGSTYHSGDVSDQDKEEADYLVRKVAPDTLGIPARSITCYNELPEDHARALAGQDNHGLEEFAKDGDGDGSGAADVEAAEEEIEEATNDGPTQMVPCNGRLYHIREAETFLKNDRWKRKAPYAESLQSTFERWKDGPPDG